MNFMLLERRVFGNMVTWQELNEKLNKIDWSGPNSEKEFNATTCNEIAHDAIMKHERSLAVNLIKNAAESGCFRTILPKCHSDTTKWLIDLGFKVFYQGQVEVSWED